MTREGLDKHCTRGDKKRTLGRGPNEKKAGKEKSGAIFMSSFRRNKRKLKDFVYAIRFCLRKHDINDIINRQIHMVNILRRRRGEKKSII